MYRFFQYLPEFKGKLRLAKYLFKNLSGRREFRTRDGLSFIVPNLIENVSFELFVNGFYERKYLKIISDNLPLNGVFVDVGANIGAISVVLAKHRPDVKIYAFEASREVFWYLQENKRKNSLANLYLFNKAIHTADNLEMQFYSPEDANGKGSFSPVFTDKFEKVITLSLDTFFRDNQIIPDLIKIDVEGYEALVIDSMNIFLNSNEKCKLIFEFVDWAESMANYSIGTAQENLLKKNYRLLNIDNDISVNKPILNGCAMILAYK